MELPIDSLSAVYDKEKLTTWNRNTVFESSFHISLCQRKAVGGGAEAKCTKWKPK